MAGALSNDDKARIRSSMNKFVVNLEDNMLRFYATFMSTYPQYMPMFYSLKGVSPDPETLLRNDWLRAQGPRFASAVVDFVENLENYDALQQSIIRLVQAPRHTKHNLTTDDYMLSMSTFVQNMKSCLAEEMTSADVESWKRFLNRLRILFDSEMKNVNNNKTHAPLSNNYSMPF